MTPINTLLAKTILQRSTIPQRGQHWISLSSREVGLGPICHHRKKYSQASFNMVHNRAFATKRQTRTSEAKQKDKSKMKKTTTNKQTIQTVDDVTIHAVKPTKQKHPRFDEATIIPPSLSSTVSMSPSYKQMDPKEQFLFLKDQLQKSASSTSTTENLISVNNEDLFNSEIHLRDKPDFMDPSLNYEQGTPLSDQLIKRIGLRGPLTTADYMTIALTDPTNGYYTSKTISTKDEDDLFNDEIDDANMKEISLNGDTSAIIGKHGDFTTAPEISQLFGECMLLFYIFQYRNLLNSPKAVQIVEIGPGKGTLMADVLSTACSSFPDFANALADGGGVHLVEVSPDMRKKQRDLLNNLNGTLEGYQLVFMDGQDKEQNTKNLQKEKKIIRIHWHDALSFVPATDATGSNIPHFILCQEFVDALPIHSFQKHSDGSWRERMVDVDINPDADNINDPISSEDIDVMLQALPNQQKKPRLRFVLSKDTTPALDALLKISHEQKQNAAVGDVIEVCPMGLMLAQDISERLSQCKGASLLIDYGTEFGNGDTLRGFLNHKQVHPLSLSGRVDVTADVTFGALRQEAEKVNGVKCFGPTTQGEFLNKMGAVERVMALIDDDETTDEQAEELYVGLERLVSYEEMGERYKILSIVSGSNMDAPGF